MSVPHWGSIANPELDRQRVKAVYFFAGDWRSSYNPIQFYEHPSAGPNDHYYTVHPADGRHLGWSVRVENRAFAVDEMMRAGANVVTMSYWGERGTDRWRYWSPMQTSTWAHDQLFDVTLGRPLLILPAIEGGAATPASPAFEFSNEFPPDDVARLSLVAQIKDLITRYIQAPQDPLWSTRWLQIYDQNGVRRHAIHIIQVKSNKIGPAEHARFARGFDAVANHIKRETGVSVGFTIDALLRPVINGETGLTDVYHPTAWEAGPHLRGQASLLAIQGFIPEISLSAERAEWERRDVKKQYLEDWMAQGIPTFMDLSAGYDGHLVFPPPPHGRSGIYGNNGWWRREMLALLPDRFAGVAFNTWNGYTEGYAAVPTTEHGEANFRWLQRVFRKWFDILPWMRSQPGVSVAAVWRQPGQHLDLFVTGTDGAVWSIWWEPDREWGYWSLVPNDKLSIKMQPGATATALWRQPGDAGARPGPGHRAR